MFAGEPVLTSTVIAVSSRFSEAAGLGIPVVVEQLEEVTDEVTSTHHLLGGQVRRSCCCKAIMTSTDLSLKGQVRRSCFCIATIPMAVQWRSTPHGVTEP